MLTSTELAQLIVSLCFLPLFYRVRVMTSLFSLSYNIAKNPYLKYVKQRLAVRIAESNAKNLAACVTAARKRAF